MIRIRYPEGVSTVQTEPDMTLGDLKALVFSQTSIPPDEQELRTGVPPRSLAGVPATASLSDARVNIRRGDQVLVAVRSASAAPAPGPVRTAPVSPSVSTPPAASGPARAFASAGARSKVSSAMDKVQRLREEAQAAARRRHPPPTQAYGPAPAPASVPVSAEPHSLAATAPANRKHYRALDDEFVVLNIVPDDNSCLFTSVAVVLRGSAAPAEAQRLRRTVAEAILSRPEKYTDAFLGEAPEQYAARIQRPNVWGGAIELSVLSEHFRVEIDSIDIGTGRVDRYGESDGYDQRVYVAYSGIHYDPILLAPSLGAPLDFATTIFGPAQADRVISVVLELAEDLRSKKYYTNVSAFTLRCKQCAAALVGEKGAMHHSSVTGHTQFEEYS